MFSCFGTERQRIQQRHKIENGKSHDVDAMGRARFYVNLDIS
jgi:hypothetical protein